MAVRPVSPVPSSLNAHKEIILDSSESTTGLWFIPPNLALPPRNQRGPSHSRRRPMNHVPRPRNAFILFRSHFYAMNVLPSELDFCKDHRQISRIVSIIWAKLTEVHKSRFFALVEEEQLAHQRLFPTYQIPNKESKDTGKERTSHTKTKVDVEENPAKLTAEELQCREIAALVLQGICGPELATKIQDIIQTHQQRPRTTNAAGSSPAPSIEEAEEENVAPSSTPHASTYRSLSRSPSPSISVSSLPAAKHRSPLSLEKGSKNSLTAVYARLANPPRRARASAVYTMDYDSDSADADGLERMDMTSGIPPSLITLRGSPPSSLLSTSNIPSSAGKASEAVTPSRESSLVPVSNFEANRVQLDCSEALETEDSIHWSFEDEMGTASNSCSLEPEDSMDPLSHTEADSCDSSESLEREFFAQRGRTPFDPEDLTCYGPAFTIVPYEHSILAMIQRANQEFAQYESVSPAQLHM
ncbi:SubName: Full=Uncharacterized protein {ECO:0000313/EMBL:CCA68105.1} [Serendipita indica DSM 11827]|nr:SubName: Full=Uncharacterized protein {ECO:0000313/EMBL:CCA68105.1} [Serendipita indica DSM 11827]